MVHPVDKCTAGRSDLAYPFQRRRFLLDKGVGRGDGIDGFASGKIDLAGWVTVLELDTQHLCQSLANFGSCGIRSHACLLRALGGNSNSSKGSGDSKRGNAGSTSMHAGDGWGPSKRRYRIKCQILYVAELPMNSREFGYPSSIYMSGCQTQASSAS